MMSYSVFSYCVLLSRSEILCWRYHEVVLNMVTNGTGSLSVSTKTPSRATTLADVISHLQERHALPQQRRHDLTSAVRTVARLLGQPDRDIEANPAAIRQRLAVGRAMAGQPR